MNKYIFLILLFCTLTLPACSDWFNVTTDDKTIDENALFTNDNAFLNALADVYTQLREPELYGNNLSLMLDFAAQNFVPDTELSERIAAFDYADPRVEETARKVWKNLYRAIASCNKILKHIETTDVTFNHKDHRELITGELYALRGTLHFELLRLFHPHPSVDASFTGMPYMTSFGSKVGEALTTGEVIELITLDLHKALELLDGRDPLFSPTQTHSMTPGSLDRRLRTFHLNYYAVCAVMARLNQYTGNNDDALFYAEKTFGHIRNVGPSARIFYYFGPGQYGSDLSFSREHIFGIASPPEGFTALSERLFSDRKISVRADFAVIFPVVKDTRFRDWFVLSADGYIMQPKFSIESLLAGYTSTSGVERTLPARIPFIKLGEVSLIAAEALNEQGETNRAAQWIIELQDYRDVTIVKDLLAASALTQAGLREAIRAEYHREFYGEGQLFHFHKRKNDSQLTKYDGSALAMTASDYTFPIPTDGLSAAAQ